MSLASGLIKVAGPYTLRASMEALFKKTKFESGRNWQNIEKSKRAIVVAPKGFVIVQADQKGADARIVAGEVPNGNFASLFKYKIKPHTFVALRRYWKEFAARVPDMALQFEEAATVAIKDLKGLSYWPELSNIIASSDNWESRARYYYMGKTQCHMLNYKAGWLEYKNIIIKRTEGRLFLPDSEAKLDVQNYRTSLFPEIFNEWHPRVLDTAKLNREIRNLFGHPFKITGNVDEIEKELYAYIPQSTVAIITHLAFIKLSKFIRENKLDWHPFNNCHDSYAAYIPREEVGIGMTKMKEFMECDLTSTLGEKYKMESSIASGKNWAPFDRDKNPDGLVET